MKKLFGASLTIAFAAVVSSAFAAGLPEVKVSAGNKVPQCATPGRLTSYLKVRNPRLDPRFEDLAAQYQHHGEALGIRWDIAFFQMILETGALRFTGDVRPDQNNFAGLGASGGGARGERFADLSSGVKAHLQHLLMYAGDHIDEPVAERTRKVQAWGVLTAWQKSIDGPMTYALIAQQWAPTSRNYVRDITAITDDFYSAHCDGNDPNPGIQEAKVDTPKAKSKKVQAATVLAEATATDTDASDPAPEKVSGAELAKRNIEAERKEGMPLKALGANMMGSLGQAAKPAAQDGPPVTLLNDDGQATAEAPQQDSAPASDTKTKEKGKPETKSTLAKAESKPAAKGAAKGAEIQTAALGSAATQLKPPPAKGDKCKVWTASYGGQRAVIIKANGNGTLNYTVLDVTETNEKREVDAYIAAYAKGGEKLASFPSQTKALSKAFELCPEG